MKFYTGKKWKPLQEKQRFFNASDSVEKYESLQGRILCYYTSDEQDRIDDSSIVFYIWTILYF